MKRNPRLKLLRDRNDSFESTMLLHLKQLLERGILSLEGLW